MHPFHTSTPRTLVSLPPPRAVHAAVFVLSFKYVMLAVVVRQLPFRARFNYLKTAASKTGEFTKKACSMGAAGSYFFI